MSLIGFYHFEECEPEDVVYQLDYNSERIANKADYVGMFQDCGWEYLQDFWGYSYFRKSSLEMNGEEEIFCDDASKMEMMQRVFKGRLLPLAVMFFVCILPTLCMDIYLYAAYGNEWTPVMVFMVWLLIAECIFYVVMFAWFGAQYWEYFKSVHR